MKRLEELFTSLSSRKGGVEYIIVGLGNPGKEYEKTRHNAGFLAVDFLAKKETIALRRVRFHSLSGEGTIAGKRVLVLKPNTYMNNSGKAVREALDFYKIPPSNLIVLCDDVSLPSGTLRIRRKGSDGGQKGLRSIAQHLGTQDYLRIRLGVGEKPHPAMDLADWVLSAFLTGEEKAMQEAYNNASEAVRLLLFNNVEEAMAKFN